MLIIGNSHVSLFNNGINCPQENINIHWVGALKIDWFFNKHPGAIKIENEFKIWNVKQINIFKSVFHRID